MKVKLLFFFGTIILIFNSCKTLEDYIKEDNGAQKAINIIGEDKAINIIDEKRKEAWPKPFDSLNNPVYIDNTLGDYLQKYFKSHCKYCNFGIYSLQRDLIPGEIKDRIVDERDSIFENASMTIEYLLVYKFDSVEICHPLEKQNITFANDKLPKIELPELLKFGEAQGFPSFLYIGDCSSQIQGDIELGFSPPIASVNSAVEMDVKKNSKIIVYSGRFVSPLFYVFDAPSITQMQILFDLWDFYKDNTSYINNCYYLREFKGLTIKHFAGSQEVSQISADASFDVGMIPMTNISGNISVEKQVNNLFSSKNWNTFIYPDFDTLNNKRVDFFEPYKNIDYITTYFLNNISIVDENKPIMVEGEIYEHQIFIEGFPENKSSNTYWTLDSVTPNVYKKTPTVKSEFYEKNNKKGCLITISGEPNSKVFQSETGEDIEIYYRFKNSDLWTVDGTHLKIQYTGNIQPNLSPRIIYNSYTEYETNNIIEDSIVTYQWIFKPIIIDEGNKINKDLLPQIDTIYANFGQKELNVKYLENGFVSINRPANEYKLIIETKDLYTLNELNQPLQTEDYRLVVEFWVTLNSKKRIKKKIISTINIPIFVDTEKIIE